MARYDVTKELASIIKSTRMKYGITAKSIAEHIGKSQAYISKLEKGELKTIDQDIIIDIFEFILGSEQEFQRFLNEELSSVLSSLTLRHNSTEIQNQMWFNNFDTVIRLIPIPESLIRELNEIMGSCNITVDYLVDRINSNEAIQKHVENLEDYSENNWHFIVENGEIKSVFIRLKLNSSDVEGILDLSVKSTNYVSMLAITYYLLIIQTHGNNKDISEDSYIRIHTQAVNLLNKHHFYSIEEKAYLESRAENEPEREALLSEFDRENSKTISEIIQIFKMLSDVDLLKTTEYLKKFKKNLEWDSGFIFRIISLEFDSLNEINYSQKKELLTEFIELIKRYQLSAPTLNKVDFYD